MINEHDPFLTNRVILVHKQGTSARTRFLRFAAGSVLGFSPLPTLSTRAVGGAGGGVVPLGRGIVRLAAERLGLEPAMLELEAAFAETIETPDGLIHIHLARFTSIDPPFELAASLEAKFIDITEARQIPPIELQLLRRAYETVMG